MKHKNLLIFAAALLGLAGCSQNNDYHKATCIDDLEGYKVGVMLGGTDELYIENDYPGIQLLPLMSPPDLFLALQTGKVDFMVSDTITVFGKDLDAMGIEVLGPSGAPAMDVCFGFRKDDTELCRIFNEFLAGAKQSGLYTEIRNRWTTGDVGSVVMPHVDLPSEGEPIRVGQINDFPFSFVQDGRWAGMEMELLERFASYIGRPLVTLDYEFSALIAGLSSGKLDITGGFMYRTEERAKQVLFSDPYYNCSSIIYGRKDPREGNGFFAGIKDSFRNNIIVENRWKLLLEGLKETCIISLFSILLGTLFGALLCSMSLSRKKYLNAFAHFYGVILEGIPQLVFLMLMFYVVFASSSIEATWVAVLSFAMVFGAASSEIFCTGIKSVDYGQTEAGLALGFTKAQTFLHFVLPQALRKVMPIYNGECVSLIKETSIVGYIAIADLTKVSDMIRSRTFDSFFPLIVITILYFVIAWGAGKLLSLAASRVK